MPEPQSPSFCVVALVPDLIFATKIASTGRTLGVQVETVRTVEELADKLGVPALHGNPPQRRSDSRVVIRHVNPRLSREPRGSGNLVGEPRM